MTLLAFSAYVLALFAAAATPGPSMFAVITTAMTRGTRPAIAIGLGVAASDVALVSVTLLGLAAIAATFGWVMAVIKYAGAAYLIWSGYRMWCTGGSGGMETKVAQGGLWRAAALGAAIGFGNPKAVLFHLSLMPLLLDLGSFGIKDVLLVMAAVFCVNIITMSTYAMLAGKARRALRSARARRLMFRLGGGAMAGTGVAIAARQ